MWRVVIRPALLRPPLLLSGRTSDFSGVVRVTSTKSATDEPRRPGVVGLYLRIAMSVCLLGRSGARAEDVDGTLAERDDGAPGVLALADAEAGTPRLALAVHRVDRVDLDVEDLLDGDLDLRLVRPGVDEERVLALVEKAVGLLRDDRGDEDVARVLDVDAHLPSSLSCVWPAWVKPAASAASAVRNQTSAIVASYHWPPGWWYFIESALPLMSKPAGAEPSSSAAAESGPYPPSVASATATGWSA